MLKNYFTRCACAVGFFFQPNLRSISKCGIPLTEADKSDERFFWSVKGERPFVELIREFDYSCGEDEVEFARLLDENDWLTSDMEFILVTPFPQSLMGDEERVMDDKYHILCSRAISGKHFEMGHGDTLVEALNEIIKQKGD
jgi:hypothetical protein